jgi:hypothetical protein
MQSVSTAAGGPSNTNEDRDYGLLLEHLHRAVRVGPLFTTDAAGLYDTLLGELPSWRRRHYECRACRKFVDTYGGLVTIGDDGLTGPVFWSVGAPEIMGGFFGPAVDRLYRAVQRAHVTGVFLTDAEVIGLPTNRSDKSPTGAWHHMHADACCVQCKPGPLKTCDQVAAEKREDYATLQRALAEYPLGVVAQVRQLLQGEALYRSEKLLGVAKWLHELQEARNGVKHSIRENLVWRAVATAPAGFCHVRNTVVGTLLDDLVAGKSFAEVKRAFDSKMAPLKYQRPQAAPTNGQLAAAESTIAKLRSAGALERRFATLDDIADDAVWMPRAAKAVAPTGEVFGHLRTDRRSPSTLDVPAQVITWDKFWRTVLPSAEKVECLVAGIGNFFAFVTAVDPAAPPILQWDRDEARNPVSWYVYPGGSYAANWGLAPGWVDVVAITTQPSSWGGGAEHQGNGAYFVLAGARDRVKSGLGLFPEILRADYHGIRASIEAYSRSRELAGAEALGIAAGLACQKSSPNWSCTVRVTTGGTRVSYRLDRWD